MGSLVHQDQCQITYLSIWVSILAILQSWDNGQPEWIPYSEGLPRQLVVSVFSVAGLCSDPGEAPLISKKRGAPCLPGSLGGDPPVAPGPPRGGSLSPPGDSGSQGPPRQSFI